MNVLQARRFLITVVAALAMLHLDGVVATSRMRTRSNPAMLRRSALIDSTNFTPNISMLNTATDTIASSQRASWEQGTAASAFLELWHAPWSVWAGANAGPPYRPDHVDPRRAPRPEKVLSMGLRCIAAQDGIGRLSSRVTGDESTSSGSALDSASGGEAVLIGAFVEGDINEDNAVANSAGVWFSAAQRQLAFVLNTVPRATNGAISHRFPEVQIWSDGVYMGPPFYAQYGLMTRNRTLLQLAYDQCRLYRDILRITQGTSTGLWAHIWAATSTTGTTNATTTQTPGFRWIDSNSWVTGNGWASAGMLRVAATIAQSPFANDMSSQINDLTTWTREILDAAFPLADPATGLFHNYANVSTQFLDSAGSSLLAYSAFRLASMGGLDDTEVARLVEPAERIYAAVQAGLDPLGDLTSGLDVVNVLSFNIDSTHSSTESLSFLLLLAAARRDFAAGNVTGTAGPGTSNAGKHGSLSSLPGSKSSGSSISVGPIVGGVLGGLVAGILATLLALWCIRRRCSRHDRHDQTWTRARFANSDGDFDGQVARDRNMSSMTTLGTQDEKYRLGHRASATQVQNGGSNSGGSSSPSRPTLKTAGLRPGDDHAAQGGVPSGVAAGAMAKGDDSDELPTTAVDPDHASDKYTLWKSSTADLPRGVSFKEGTKAQGQWQGHGHRRTNTTSSIGSHGGQLGRSGTLSRAGSERRRAAVRAQESAVFDEDEMTVHDHGGSNPAIQDIDWSNRDTSALSRAHGQDVPTVTVAPVSAPSISPAPPRQEASHPLATSATGRQESTTPKRSIELASGLAPSWPMNRAQSSGSSSSNNGGGNRDGSSVGHSKMIGRLPVPPPLARKYSSSDAEDGGSAPVGLAVTSDLPTPASVAPSASSWITAIGPSSGLSSRRGITTAPTAAVVSKPTDYFATPGAANASRANSLSDHGSAVAVPFSSVPPPRPARHSRKPSSRAKALRENRDNIFDNIGDDGPASSTGHGQSGGNQAATNMSRTPSAGIEASDTELATRAEEGAALKGRVLRPHQRTTSNASSSHSHARSASHAASPVPVPAFPSASSHGRSASQANPSSSSPRRQEEARELQDYLNKAEEELRSLARANSRATGRPAGASTRSNAMASGADRSRSADRSTRPAEPSAPAMSQTRSASEHRSAIGADANGRSIRTVNPASAALGGFNSVSEGVQYPSHRGPSPSATGTRTASTRQPTTRPGGSASGGRTRVPSNSSGEQRPRYI